jgi:hypothetical protein
MFRWLKLVRWHQPRQQFRKPAGERLQGDTNYHSKATLRTMALAEEATKRYLALIGMPSA